MRDRLEVAIALTIFGVVKFAYALEDWYRGKPWRTAWREACEIPASDYERRRRNWTGK